MCASKRYRTAVDIDVTLDKEATSYNDIFDAFRLSLISYRSAKQSDGNNERKHEYKYECGFEGIMSLR